MSQDGAKEGLAPSLAGAAALRSKRPGLAPSKSPALPPARSIHIAKFPGTRDPLHAGVPNGRRFLRCARIARLTEGLLPYKGAEHTLRLIVANAKGRQIKMQVLACSHIARLNCATARTS